MINDAIALMAQTSNLSFITIARYQVMEGLDFSHQLAYGVIVRVILRTVV